MKALYSKITPRHIAIFIMMLAVAISLQCYFASAGQQYTRYNNYVIFKNSFKHLLSNQNLYAAYPSEDYDLFKYSPTFAIFMGVFYYLPDGVGLLLFNLLNVGLFLYAFLRFQFDEKKQKLILLFLLVEIAISLTSTQTNLLIAGLILLSFLCLENKKPFWAALCIVLTAYIKIFGIVAFALWFLYPNKLRFILYALFWTVVLALLPLILISRNELVQQYQNWKDLLKEDHSISYGASFIGWIHSWFKVDVSKIGTVAGAAILFCVPFIKTRLYKLYEFRLQILASILIWIVIFNHRAESPTYCIALTGVAIWYFSQQPRKAYTILLWLCLIFTSFSSTDLITPSSVYDNIVEPYALKAVFPCIIWLILIYDLLRERSVKTLPGY